MSFSQEYPVILGESHMKLPKNTQARYIILSDSKLYRKGIKEMYCGKCDIKHKVYDWIPITPKRTLGFVDIHKDTVKIINPPQK
jgi:hypothetical protein